VAIGVVIGAVLSAPFGGGAVTEAPTVDSGGAGTLPLTAEAALHSFAIAS